MAPHLMETILRPPQWPVALSDFVTWCLMWDPRNRPTSTQALKHDYFVDAVDPLRPKSSTSRFLGRKQHSSDSRQHRAPSDIPQLTSKPSWFRKSIIGKENVPNMPPTGSIGQPSVSRPTPVHANTVAESSAMFKTRPFASKRATWTNNAPPAKGAPMPILPSIRPISPFSDSVTAQADTRPTANAEAHPNMMPEQKVSKKIGRQLSVASHGNHYADCSRQEAERTLNGARDITSPGGTQKEGFFSHLRKRARRLSGRPQAPVSPTPYDIEANAGCGPWQNNRGSVNIDGTTIDPLLRNEMSPGDLEKALQSPSHTVVSSPSTSVPPSHKSGQYHNISAPHPFPERQPSSNKAQVPEGAPVPVMTTSMSNRTRRALQQSTNPSQMYETPDEEDELLHEALHTASKAAKGMERWRQVGEDHRNAVAYKDVNQQPMSHMIEQPLAVNPYPTPSPSAKGSPLHSQHFQTTPAQPLNINRTRPKEEVSPRWPTPPYEENEWAAAAAASIFAAGSVYR